MTDQKSAPGLEQTELWVNRAGETVRVDDMDLDYLCAVQKHLENRYMNLRFSIEWQARGYLMEAPELAASVLERAIEEDYRLTPSAYMARYPFYRRVSELLGDRRAEDGWPGIDIERRI